MTTKKSKPDSNAHYIWGFVVLMSVGIASMTFFGASILGGSPSGFASCSIQGIELKNVSSGGECWDNSISAEYCPIPSSVSCTFEGSVPLAMAGLLSAGDY